RLRRWWASVLIPALHEMLSSLPSATRRPTRLRTSDRRWGRTRPGTNAAGRAGVISPGDAPAARFAAWPRFAQRPGCAILAGVLLRRAAGRSGGVAARRVYRHRGTTGDGSAAD